MRKLKVGIIILLAFSSSVVSAQNDSILLEEVEVVSKIAKREMTSTAPLHLIGQADINSLGITNIADALQRMPGVMLRDYGGAGGMKTVSVRGFGTQHTGVAYDGVMLSECQSGQIDLSRYSINLVDVMSLAVGDNADIFIPARQASLPAVLNIQTEHTFPVDERAHLRAGLVLGSFGFASPYLRFTKRLGRTFSLSALGEYTYAENDYPFTLKNGKITTVEKRSNSRMNTGHGEINFMWLVNSNSMLSGKLYYYDNDRLLPGQVRYYTNVSGESLRDRNAFVQSQWRTWNTKGNLSIRVDGKFNWVSSIYKDALYPGGVMDASYWQREYYGSVCMLYLPTDNWAIDYSADYTYNNLNSSLSTDSHPYRNTILQSFSVRYTVSRLTVLARMLHSMYFNNVRVGTAARNFTRLSPSASLSLKIISDEELYLRLSYKNIFRAPTFNESYFYHYGSTDLNAESTDQVNIGCTWQHKWNSRLSSLFIVDAYLNQVKDKIVAVPFNMFVWTNVNLGSVSSHGMEITLKSNYRLAKGQSFTLHANWNYQRVKNVSDKSSEYYGYQIAYQPLHTGSVACGWENRWLNLSVHGTAMSSRWANNEHYEGTKLKGFYEMGVAAWKDFKLKNHSLSFRLDVLNLTDSQYEIVSLYPMPGRSWKATLSYEL